MKQQVDPKIFIAIVAVAAIVFAFFAWRTFAGPSATPVSSTNTKPMGPRDGGGGPTEADLEKMREYNRTHPGAVSAYK